MLQNCQSFSIDQYVMIGTISIATVFLGIDTDTG